MDEAKIVALSERAKKGAQLLAQHARIPPPCREQFLNEMGQILFSAGLDDTGNIKYWGDQQLKKTVLEVEAGLRRALIAIRSFPVPFFFTIDGPFPEVKIEDLAKKIETGEIKTTKWEDTLAPMVEWCAGFTGKSPRVQARVSQRGRCKGDRTKASYSLRLLIWQLALSVERGHGKLTLNRTNKSGTWIDALNDLRPLFPGIIPSALPLPMIEKLKAEAKKGALTG